MKTNVEERKLEWAKKTVWHTATTGAYDKLPLYTHPHQWQGLTDEELDEIGQRDLEAYDFARAIESKLKEKNT